MKRLRRHTNRHPRATALTVLGIFAAIFALPILLIGPVDFGTSNGRLDIRPLLGNLPMQAMICAVVLAIVALLGWWPQTGLTTRIDLRGLRVSIIVIAIPLTFFVLAAILLLQTPPVSAQLTLLGLILALNLCVGLFEETLFRGILLHGLRARHGLWTAIISSSLLFGLFHIVNLAIGQDWAFTVFQVVSATALGILLCGVFLQSHSLWPAVVLHAIWNSYAMAAQEAAMTMIDDPMPTTAPAVTPAAYILPMLITLLGVWIIRRWQRRQPPPVPALG